MALKSYFKVFRLDLAGCAGCASELDAISGLNYDTVKNNFVFIENPYEANVLLVTGGINVRNRRVLVNALNCMPEEKIVIAAGACACSGGMFNNPDTVCSLDSIVPVNVYIRGCAPNPDMILEGISSHLKIKRNRK